jgi:DNA-binding XRE family transcriptional regulator
MPRRSHIFLPPEATESIRRTGERLRKARLRRNMTIEEVAEKLGIHRETLTQAERGNPATAVWTIVGALWIYGLLPGLAEVASPAKDEVGQSLEALETRQRARPGLGGMDNDF